MRGKNILIVAMLLSIAMMSMGFVKGGDTATKIHVSPTVVTGNPGDKFWVDITIEKTTDLYGWQIKLQYESGTKVLGALKVEEGGFLWGPDGTAMAYSIDPIGGVVDVGCSIMGDWPGTTGDGLLCRIQFVVVEAGESVLSLFGTVLLDSNLDKMIHQTRDGFFDGINVELTMINIGARSMHVGDIQEFDVKVQNEDGKGQPLYVKARIDNTRIEDGKTTSLWTGQNYEYPPLRDPIYLYVDGFTAERAQWTEVGTSPFLTDPDDGNEIVGNADSDQHRWFTFENFTLGEFIIDYVELEVYSEGPYDESIDYDCYATGFNWLGSYYGTGEGRVWQTVPRWAGGAIASEMYPALLTEEGINNLEIMWYNYGGGGADNIIDAMRLHVVFVKGRPAEYPGVDGFTAERAQWTEVGTSPFLNASDDGNEIVGSANGAQHRWFTFEDIDLGTSVVDEVRLWVYLEGPYNELIDLDCYATGFNWLGSYYGTGEGRIWQDVPRWAGNAIASEMYPALLTEEGINGFEVMWYYYDPEGVGEGTDIIDAMYLEITFLADRVALPLEEPLYVVQPGEVRYLDPLIWPLQPEDLGTYICTVTVYYSYAGTFFNTGDKKVITESWHVK